MTSSMDKSVIIYNVPSGTTNQVWENSDQLGEVGGANMGFLGRYTNFSGKISVLMFSHRIGICLQAIGLFFDTVYMPIRRENLRYLNFSVRQFGTAKFDRVEILGHES